jgi:signal transduction histidine kinase
MEIALYSNDPELDSLCRDIVRLTPGAKCTVKEDFRTPPDSPSAMCIFDASLGDLGDLPECRKSILIIDRAHLAEIRSQTLHLRSVILLKPLSRAQLEIAIEQSMNDEASTLDGELLARLNRDDLLECLLNTNLRLQEFEQGRTHFLTRAVHELRAPLTSLNGYCELFLAGKLGQLSNEQLAIVARMLRSVTRLARIVSTMFDLTVGQSCDSRPQYQLGNILGSVDQAIHEIAPRLRDRNIELDLDLLPPEGPLFFDPQKMEQVFLNLFENSCKFVPRGGFIRVHGYPWFWERRLSRTNGHPYPGDRRRTLAAGKVNRPAANAYRIDIADNGPGIRPEQLDHLFEEFTLYGGGGDRSGVGLGLAICRMIANQHNGKLWAESPFSKGAKFCVVLPHFVEQPASISRQHTVAAAI